MGEAVENQPSGAVAAGIVFTHGTAETRDLPPAREFFEDVLGLRCVRHSPITQLVAGCVDFGIVSLNARDKLTPQGSQNRWIVSVGDAAAVADAHARALASDFADEVSDITEEDGIASFRIHDNDSNWWDVTNLSANHYDAMFEKGDVA